MRSLLLLGGITALTAAASAAEVCDEYCRNYYREPLLVVETTDCEGNYGLASFAAERVFKIAVAKCRDPADSGSPLYQLTLKSLVTGGDYEILWLDAAGVQTVRKQLEENRQAALRRR